jgi:hypothetical protein
MSFHRAGKVNVSTKAAFDRHIYEPIVVTGTDGAKLEFVSTVAFRRAILALGRRATIGNLHLFEFLAGRENEVVGGHEGFWHALRNNTR